MKIVNIKKFIRTISLILLVILGLSLIISKATLSHKEVSYNVISVDNGDTLWNISKELQNNSEYYKGKDIRDIIKDIIKINNLKSSTVYANQELKIPVI